MAGGEKRETLFEFTIFFLFDPTQSPPSCLYVYLQKGPSAFLTGLAFIPERMTTVG